MQYLLPGIEFLTELRTIFGTEHTVETSCTRIVFGHESDYLNTFFDFLPTEYPLDTNKTGSIYGRISNNYHYLVVVSTDAIGTKDCSNMFEGLSALKSVQFENFDTAQCTTMYGMFMDCTSLEDVQLHKLDTTLTTDFRRMFYNCRSLVQLDLGNFRVHSSIADDVSDMLAVMPNLRRLTVGPLFEYTIEMGLSNPDPEYIPKTNGKWYDILGKTEYTAATIPQYSSTSYYAIPVGVDFDDELDLISYKTAVLMFEEVISKMSSTISYRRIGESTIDEWFNTD